jgi:hypothetical protein
MNLRNTLAFRLTLWYAGIFTLSSCVAFLFFYMLITSFIRERTDQELLGQVNRFSMLLAAEGVEAVQNTAVIEAQAAGVKKVFFRLLSLNGQAFSSSNMAYWKDIYINETANRSRVSGETRMIQRMLSNLLDNAIQYTPSGGSVTVSATEDKTHVVISVKGTGIGISSSDLPRILERFYRCDQSRAQDGIALGITVQNLTPEITQGLGLKKETGVVVTQVEPGSPASDAGIQMGDVIREVDRKPVKDVEDFVQKVEKAKDQDSVLLFVQRGQNNLFAAVTPK